MGRRTKARRFTLTAATDTDAGEVQERPDFERLPRHIAIIMDGNGRWARVRGRPRTFGHEQGVRSIREVTNECSELSGIDYLTLYALSHENYTSRPRSEVRFLLLLLRRYLQREQATFHANNIRLNFIGEWEVFPAPVRSQIRKSREETAENTGVVLTFALNYGARAEIVRAVRRLCREVTEGILSLEAVTEEELAARLDTGGMPDPDLLIRTAGEMRLSNFLLWQASYAEFWSTEICWPDFRKELLWAALEEYGRRVRKFGALSPKRTSAGARKSYRPR